MLKNGKRTPPHIFARQRLLDRISSLSAKGVNRLPPERELCDEFGVSLNTVKKAIRQLIIEGRIVSVLRRGHFIRAVAAETNIGIVIGEGSVSTFLQEPDVMSAILDVLARRNCLVRIIQLREPKAAPHVFSQYKIDGCIWYMPHTSLYLAISKIMKNCSVPIVVPIMTYKPAEAAKLPRNHFTNDFTAVGRVRAEYLLKRGHRNIVYCASNSTGTYEGFAAALGKAGVVQNPGWNIPKIEDIPERLSRILESGEVTAIISDGGRTRLEAVFRVLDGHPWGGKGELLVDFIGGGFAELRGKYPKVKVSAVNFYPHQEIGTAAAEAIADAVKEGRPIQSAKFASQVRSPDWMPYRERLPVTM
ncbi:MAG: GntR family transcriptional regulator [Victivallales bacterium]|jgi:DNA-binding LacI/PurR family transcriptional regulator